MDWDKTCELCQVSGKIRKSGPLSTRDSLTAHMNCLLYSSGLYIPNSPEDEELFGFSVEDIREEIARGSKLICHLCKKKGATVGCEEKRCKRSYHFPCALKDHAEAVADNDKGTYVVYCSRHIAKRSADKAGRPSLNGDPDKPQNPKGEVSAGKDNAEGSILALSVEKRKRLSLRKKSNGMVSADAVAGPSSHADADTLSKYTSSKRLETLYAGQEVTPSRLLSLGCLKRKRILKILDSDEDLVDMECAPLETDIEDSGYSVHRVIEPQHQPAHSKDNETPAYSTSGCHSPPQNQDGDDGTLIDSDAESQSLLLPVRVIPLTDSSGTLPCPLPVTAGPSHRTAPPSPPGVCRAPSPAPSSSANRSLPAEGEADVDAARFWRSCNRAGCTEAIFDDFIADMTGLSKRILTDQASQDDYDVSLRVLQASGQLTRLVAQQGKERKRKLKEAEESLAAIEQAWSILKG